MIGDGDDGEMREIVEEIAEAASVAVAEHEARAALGAEINEAMISAQMQRLEEEHRAEFEERVNARVVQLGEELSECLSKIETLEVLVTEMVLTVTVPEPMPSIPQPSEPPSPSAEPEAPTSPDNPATARPETVETPPPEGQPERRRPRRMLL